MRSSTAGRVLGPVLVLALTVVVVALMADATRYTVERGRTGTTRVVFRIETRGYHHGPDDAAIALWMPCVGAVGWTAITPPRALGDDRYVAEVRPSLGEHASRRLRGCLEDTAVDRVRGDVIETHVID